MSDGKTEPTSAVCLDVYVARWMRWSRTGLDGLPSEVADLSATPPQQTQAEQAGT